MVQFHAFFRVKEQHTATYEQLRKKKQSETTTQVRLKFIV